LINKGDLISEHADFMGDSGVLNYRSMVFSDLIDAEENGKGHMNRVFTATKWQKEKDHLVDSMQYHLTKYRPSVKLSAG
jgi:hypothetical protein